MEHPEALVLDSICPEPHKRISWKSGQYRTHKKFHIFLSPAQPIESAQIAKYLQPKLRFLLSQSRKAPPYTQN